MILKQGGAGGGGRKSYIFIGLDQKFLAISHDENS